MRRLAPRLAPALQPPSSSSFHPRLSLASVPSGASPLLSHALTTSRPPPPRRTALAATATPPPVKPACSLAGDFTSFELEAELALAQQDLEQAHALLQTSVDTQAAVAEPQQPQPPSPVLAPTSTAVRLASSTPATATVGRRLQTEQRGPQASLPAALRCSRWGSVVHERYVESKQGYVDACAHVLCDLRRAWEEAREHVRCDRRDHRRCCRHADTTVSTHAAEDGGAREEEEEEEEEEDSAPLSRAFATTAISVLRHAHADALLVLLERVTGSYGSGHAVPHAPAAAAFDRELTAHLVALLVRRSTEMSGKRMAHLSAILLRCPFLLAPLHRHGSGRTSATRCAALAAVQDRVWQGFSLLCYATRRILRRQQNADCLEALLWGVYYRVQQEDDDLVCRTTSMERDTAAHHGRNAVHAHCVLPPRLEARVRRAALCHLVHRCLLTDATPHRGARESAMRATTSLLLLSWSVLLAWADMDPVVRAAVSLRLSRAAPAAAAPPASVEQWRRLALRVVAALPDGAPVAATDTGGRGGSRRREPVSAASVFEAVEQRAANTDGWAVSAVDRRLVLGLLAASTTLQSPVPVDPLPAVSWRKAREPAASALQVLSGAASALRAYARLRWSPPDGTGGTGGAGRGWRVSASPASVCAAVEECAEVAQAAVELPLHGVCLAEALCERLLRLLHHIDGSALDGAGASLQRRLLVALLRLSVHARADVTASAVLQLQPHSERNGNADGREGNSHASWASARGWLPLLLAGCVDSEAAVQTVREWMRQREMMAHRLSVASVARVREWVLALPCSAHSPELARVLGDWAEREKDKTSGGSDRQLVGATRLAAAVNNSAVDFEAAWAAVVRAARGQQAALALLAAWEGSPAGTPCRQWSGAELHRTHSALSGPAAARVPVLRWVAYVNSSAVREWQLCLGGVIHPATSLSQPETLPDALRLVVATEAEVPATNDDAKDMFAVPVLRHTPGKGHHLSWSEQVACRALEAALEGVSGAGDLRAALSPPAVDGDDDRGRQPELRRWGRRWHGLASAAAVHYLDAASGATSPITRFSAAELHDAVWILAAYADHVGSVVAAAGDGRRRRAAVAFLQCLVDVWDTDSAPDTADGRAVPDAALPLLYPLALKLCDDAQRDATCERGDQAGELPRVPCLNAALHERALRAMLAQPHAAPDAVAEALLLADRVARCGPPVVGGAATSGAALPWSVYQLVLTSFVVSGRPVPPPVRLCCEAALQRSGSGVS
ncbi:hypothetical protein NESM_000505500 [Novymonas esmeraldas]|uniref:Uncharacterized protein n=1 Tax=Novymonas esmeraldas TaxID=1808958 RepID=A0AAW0ERG7_9TRYP